MGVAMIDSWLQGMLTLEPSGENDILRGHQL